MAEDLDYVPMPDKVVDSDREGLGERDQGRGRQAVCSQRPTDVTCRGKAPHGAFPLSTVAKTRLARLPGRGLSGLPRATTTGSLGCSPPGGETWLIWRCRAEPFAASEAASRSKALARLRLGDTAFRHLTRAAAIARSAHPRRRHRLAGHGLAAGAAAVRLRLPGQRALEPGHRELRRAGADLRHARHLVHRDADRGAGRPDDRDVPHRAVPAYGCGGRSASRSSCSPASPASSTASGACSCSRRSCRRRCSRS